VTRKEPARQYTLLYAAGYLAEQVPSLWRSRPKPFLTRLGVCISGAHNRHSIDGGREGLVPLALADHAR
jgi:hypothetical protein